MPSMVEWGVGRRDVGKGFAFVMEIVLARTRVKLSAQPLSRAVESSVAYLEGNTPPPGRFARAYESHSHIPAILLQAVASGCRTIAIQLPDSYDVSLRVVREVEGYLLVHGRQFLYVAFYGKKRVLEELHQALSVREDKIVKLLLGGTPTHYEGMPGGVSTLTELSRRFTDTAFRIPSIEIVVELAVEQKLLHSAFAEYMTLMRTKSNKEFRKLYRAIPQSKAVASFSCITSQKESVRLLLYDNDISRAGPGVSVFLENGYFAVTEFLSDSPQPTFFVGNGRVKFF